MKAMKKEYQKPTVVVLDLQVEELIANGPSMGVEDDEYFGE